ncbi:MAG: serine hydrolase domain-containing protein [Spirosomataceae bacterium]
MKILFIFFSLVVCTLGFAQQRAKVPVNPSNESYQAPRFTDPNRLSKIKAALPVVEQLYKEYATKNHFPGLAFGVVVDGQLISSGATGFSHVGKKIEASTQSQFRIASMTKSLTAIAILKLRDQGKLKLDDPAATYIPELRSISYLTTDAPPITIRHLMTHAAGFPEDNPWGDRQLADSDADLLNLLKQSPSFSNDPGLTYEYSNLGFALLGRIITVVTGKPYQVYINEQIIKPLGMNHTVWEYTKASSSTLAWGYRWQENQWIEEPMEHDGSYGAMGGLITTIEDFSKYVSFHLDAWPPKNGKEMGPIKRSSVREMHFPWNFNSHNLQFTYPSGRKCPTVGAYSYGLGWVRDCEGRVYISHSGGLPGFGSQWRIMPEYGIGVIAFANLTYANIGTINFSVLDTLVRIAQLKPRELLVSSILSKRKQEIVSILPDWNTTEQNPIFAENFFPDFSIAIRRKNTKQLFDKVGKTIKINELIPENQLRGKFIIECERGSIEVFFTLTPENPALIQQLDIREIRRS